MGSLSVPLASSALILCRSCAGRCPSTSGWEGAGRRRAWWATQPGRKRTRFGRVDRDRRAWRWPSFSKGAVRSGGPCQPGHSRAADAAHRHGCALGHAFSPFLSSVAARGWRWRGRLDRYDALATIAAVWRVVLWNLLLVNGGWALMLPLQGSRDRDRRMPDP